VDVRFETIYESYRSRIIYIGLDIQRENTTQFMGSDEFFIIDSQKLIHRIVRTSKLMEAGDGETFQEQNVYTVAQTLNLERKLGKETISKLNLDKIFNEKWPIFNITLRTLQ